MHTNGTNGVQRTTTPPRQTSISPAHTPKSPLDQPIISPNGTPNGNGKSEAQTIPSISSLVHASDSVSVMADNKSNSSNNSRAGSNSPRQNDLVEVKIDEEKKASDIPHGKLSIGISTGDEDARAIRVLDRKFMI